MNEEPPKCPWPLHRGEELFKVLRVGNDADQVAQATVSLLSCLTRPAVDGVAAGVVAAAGVAAGVTGAGGTGEHALLRRVRAMLAYFPDAKYVAIDGSGLLRPLAAVAERAADSPASRQASRLLGAGVAVVALTPAPAADAGAPEPAELFSSVLLLVQRVPSAVQSARGDREAAAACGALLRARATALLERRLATPFRKVAELELDPLMGPCRALGAVLSADGAWLRFGAASALLKKHLAGVPPVVEWSRPLRFGKLLALDREEVSSQGALLLANLFRTDAPRLGAHARVPQLLARIAAAEAEAEPDFAALRAALEGAKSAEAAAQAAVDAADASEALQSGEAASSASAGAGAAARRAAEEALWSASHARRDAENALLGSELDTHKAQSLHQADLMNLFIAARLQWDAPAGAGNHSTVYPLRWPPSGAGGVPAAAKVAAADCNDLLAEAELLQALHLGGGGPDSIPRVLYVARGSYRGHAETERLRGSGRGDGEYAIAPSAAPASAEPAFIVIAPLGVALSVLLARLPPPSAGAEAAAARRALADGLADGLLEALRHAHARGVAHSNLKVPNVVLAPPPPPGSLESQSSAEELVRLLASGAWRPRGVLIDWGTARALGARASVRPQNGFQPDATETLTWPHSFFSGVEWVLRPRHDLECVAYLAAAVACSDSGAEVPWAAGGEAAGWAFNGPPRVNGDGDPIYGGDEASRADTGLRWVGPVAHARSRWLCQHPEALGDIGRRFLTHARAGRTLYSWRVSDEDHMALLAVPAVPCRPYHDGLEPEEIEIVEDRNGPGPAARRARELAAQLAPPAAMTTTDNGKQSSV